MSAPVSGFQNLSISQDMESSRSNTQSQSGRKGKGKSPLDGSGPASLAQILNPNESDEDDVEEETDEETNNRIFALDHCRQFHTTYAFQIASTEVERASVRISPTGPICFSPACTKERETPCCHIRWLLAQLSSTLPDTVGRDNISPYEQILSMGLENVCEKLQFELREGPESPTEAKWQLKKVHSTSGVTRRTRGMIRERMQVVRDIMAALSNDMTDDFRKDIFDRPGNMSPEPVLGDLEATIARVIFFNDDIFYHFKALVPRNMRATDYFRKALRKAQNAFKALEDYCEHGPVNGPFDLIWCADSLVAIVDAIGFNIAQRQPLSSTAKHEAAKTLVEILSMVVGSNYEMYNELGWDRRRAHAEPQIDRNLYERLIRKPPRNYPTEFVLTALQNLPEARPFIEQLQDLLDKLGEIGWDAPTAYKSKLRSIIAQLRAVSPEFDPIVVAAPRTSSTSPSAPDTEAGPSVKRARMK